LIAVVHLTVLFGVNAEDLRCPGKAVLVACEKEKYAASRLWAISLP
jgi:hypothetical protein